MVDTPDEIGNIKETDIVFDCPHCGKSLAIDYRGAGLTIPCTDCGKEVEVPIPEGMELTDIDSSDEEQEVRILNLRRSLAAAEFRVEQLEAQVAELAEAEAENKNGDAPADLRIRQILQMLDTLEAQNASVQKSVVAIREIAKTDPSQPKPATESVVVF